MSRNKIRLAAMKLYAFHLWGWHNFVQLHFPLRIRMPYIAGIILCFVGFGLLENNTSVVYSLADGIGITNEAVAVLLIIGGIMYALSNAHGLVAWIAALISGGLYFYLALVLISHGTPISSVIGLSLLAIIYLFDDLKPSIVLGHLAVWAALKWMALRERRKKVNETEES